VEKKIRRKCRGKKDGESWLRQKKKGAYWKGGKAECADKQRGDSTRGSQGLSQKTDEKKVRLARHMGDTGGRE